MPMSLPNPGADRIRALKAALSAQAMPPVGQIEPQFPELPQPPYSPQPSVLDSLPPKSQLNAPVGQNPFTGSHYAVPGSDEAAKRQEAIRLRVQAQQAARRG